MSNGPESRQSSDRPLILASGSAARRTLLDQVGLSFTVEPAMIDEGEAKRGARSEGFSADEAAVWLAGLKAARVARRNPDALVIGADQLLVCGERWFDKPATVDEARSHLEALRGREHTLVTAVICHDATGPVWRHVARPRLTMRAFSDTFLDAYLGREGEALTQTVGAYRLEGLGLQLFDRVMGEHAAILGLPMLPLLGYLRDCGVLLR